MAWTNSMNECQQKMQYFSLCLFRFKWDLKCTHRTKAYTSNHVLQHLLLEQKTHEFGQTIMWSIPWMGFWLLIGFHIGWSVIYCVGITYIQLLSAVYQLQFILPTRSDHMLISINHMEYGLIWINLFELVREFILTKIIDFFEKSINFRNNLETK